MGKHLQVKAKQRNDDSRVSNNNNNRNSGGGGGVNVSGWNASACSRSCCTCLQGDAASRGKTPPGVLKDDAASNAIHTRAVAATVHQTEQHAVNNKTTDRFTDGWWQVQQWRRWQPWPPPFISHSLSVCLPVCCRIRGNLQ